MSNVYVTRGMWIDLTNILICSSVPNKIFNNFKTLDRVPTIVGIGLDLPSIAGGWFLR
ncbi:hypothetical protein ACFL0L_00985 [Patescibacteria group bacterium]